MKMWEILIPTLTPEGKPLRTRFHRVWDEKVRDIANGLTVLQPAKGQWVCPQGELFVERMIPVRIACNEDQIHQIADMTATYYRQKAILFYEISNNVVIKHYG